MFHLPFYSDQVNWIRFHNPVFEVVWSMLPACFAYDKSGFCGCYDKFDMDCRISGWMTIENALIGIYDEYISFDIIIWYREVMDFSLSSFSLSFCRFSSNDPYPISHVSHMYHLSRYTVQQISSEKSVFPHILSLLVHENIRLIYTLIL